ncbi:MAG: NAD+ synthase [Patescibacteria group bacterium]
MSLILDHPHTDAVKIIAFLKETFQKQGKKKAVIAVSGGIDSALSLTLLTQALPVESIYPILLPYDNQSIDDAQAICEFNEIPNENVTVVNIKSAVDQISKADISPVRKGNIMARVRMIYVYDLAKKLDALVVGTENKSEQYLGYFTRFGDGASDIEPIQQLYKTQVRQLVEHLQLPKIFLEKTPSAGLWDQQTDEDELGFTYEQADQVIQQYIDDHKEAKFIVIDSSDSGEVVKKVIAQIESQKFKHEVPYVLSD